MGDCKFCGKSAGFFRRAHSQCKDLNTAGIKKLRSTAANAIINRDDWEGLRAKLTDIAKEAYIPTHQIDNALVKGWERALEHFLEDNFFSKDEEDCLMEFKDRLRLSDVELDQNGALTKAIQSATLREVMEGKIPNRQTVQGNIPFNLQKQESLVWVFPNVSLYEEKITKSFTGGSSGVSIKIAKGVYYRTSAFKGHPVETKSLIQRDHGTIGITTKHMYFSGSGKSIRTPYSKIINFVPYTDGIGIHTEARTAKPQLYKLDDGWFIYNLAVNLSKL